MKTFAVAAAVGAASVVARDLPVAFDSPLSARAQDLPEVVVKGNGKQSTRLEGLLTC